MGEFVVNAPIREDTMGETVASNPSLQVSVSFGRFESESLSWEKWSSFSPNKYLEEVEKCATPGSVAQKKAYFEAHYKKIAARKAEMLDQEKQAEKDLLKSENQNGEDLSGNTCGSDAQSDVSNSQGYCTKEVKQATNSTCETGRIHVDNVEEDVTESRDCESTPVEGENKELENRSDGSQQGKPEEAVHTEEEEEEEEEEIIPIEAGKVEELSPNGNNETGKGKTSQVEVKDVKLDHPEESKVNSANRESSATKTKRKPAVPTSKAHQISTLRSSRPTPTPTNKISTTRSSRPMPMPTNQISTPRSSRPTPTPTKTLASVSSSKRENYPSLSGRKNASTGENKRVANKSLHMSLSLGPSNPDPVPHTTMRKSLIMEKMGDKDIVRRAFKTFQNNFDQSKTSGEARSPVNKQVPSRGTEQKVPTSISSRKENGRPAKLDSMEKRSGNAVRSTIGLRSDIRAAKGKETSKKMEPKSNTKEAERTRTRVQSKSKEEKEAETKGLKHNVKATTLPAFYGGQKVSKGRP